MRNKKRCIFSFYRGVCLKNESRKVFIVLFSLFFIFSSQAAYAQTQGNVLSSIVHLYQKETDQIGISVYSLSDHQPIYNYNDKTLLNPASCMKVLTSVGALIYLGPNYIYKTKFSTDTYSHGIINNLYIQGSGDPTIDLERLDQIALQLKQNGVTQVSGDIVIDQSYFDGFAFDGRIPKQGGKYNFPVSAFAVNNNSFAKVGGDGKLFVPVRKKKSRFGKKSKRHANEKPPIYDAGDDSEENLIYGHVADPTTYAGSTLKIMLEKNGIKVLGIVRKGNASGLRDLYTDSSAPLAAILQRLNKKSINFFAEMILKTLAARIQGAPGSTAQGVALLKNVLSQIGVPSSEINIVNGSGLSRENRITTHALLQILIEAYNNPRLRDDFMESLPIGGIDGTLKRRFKTPDLIGNVRAKTGTLNDTMALAGYMSTHSGRKVAFSVLINGEIGKTDYHLMQEEFLQQIYYMY